MRFAIRVVGTLGGGILGFLSIAALMGDLGFKQFTDWFDPESVKAAGEYFDQGRIAMGIACYLDGLTLESTSLFLFCLLLSLALVRFFTRPKTDTETPKPSEPDVAEEPSVPKPVPHIGDIPFRELKVGHIEESVGRDDALAWLIKGSKGVKSALSFYRSIRLTYIT